jgi:mono/diheme cytochrome c family protein
VPRDRPVPDPFEPEWLERSLDRYLTWGLVFMAILIVGFPIYRFRESGLRRDAQHEQTATYTALGATLFDQNCASCHGDGAQGGGSAPTLAVSEFLGSTTDNQMHLLIAGGVSGSDMSAWSQEYGGSLTDQQVTQLVTYLRSLEEGAPSVPDWRQGEPAPAGG